MVQDSKEEQDDQAFYILARLTALPDSDLRRFLPEFQPESVRKSLLPLLERFRPSALPSSRPSRPSCKSPSPEETSRHNTLHLYTDGASRGNPGEAGAGVVIIDDQDREVLSRGYYLGQCTNNEAEYKALILGLTEAAKTDCDRLVVFLDSQLIVRQINGEYRVKASTLKPFFSEVRQLLKSFKSYSVRHVPRAENSRADSLANQGINRASRF